MREIDPIREPSEALLSSALHRLASAGSRTAPDELRAHLAATFRQHHRRRRRARFFRIGAIAACLLLVLGVAWLLRPASGSGTWQKFSQLPQPVQLAPAIQARGNLISPGQKQSFKSAQSRKPLSATAGEEDGFVLLPGYDPAISAGDLQVVRLELSASDLRMLGAPLAGDLSDGYLLADFITDRDGTPYAVRLAQ